MVCTYVQVRIQPQTAVGVEGSGPDGTPKYWQQPLHDSMTGAVAGVQLSFDDQYLLSAGIDGSFFVYQLRLPEGYTSGEQDGDLTPVPKAVLDPVGACK